MVVVMFPDYRGEGSLGGFGGRILTVMPNAIVVPVLNGLPREELRVISSRVSSLLCRPIVAESAEGLLSTLVQGYREVLTQYGEEATVVRLDTAEHPIASIPGLVQKALDTKGMVIGDLVFGPETLRSESIDEFAHLNLFPELYRQATGGRLSISCAHGFQVFAPLVLPVILPTALKIIELVKAKATGKVEWGFDGAMALGAIAAGVPVSVEGVPATTLRDRPGAKVANQFANALQMCLAARQVYQY